MQKIIEAARRAGVPDALLGYIARNVEIGISPLPSHRPCDYPVPSPDGTGICLLCGWQHAERGPGAIERFSARGAA